MWQLSISRDQFCELYPNFHNPDIFERPFKSDSDFIENYLASKLWRLNNIYTIIDKYGRLLKFKMNPVQHLVYAELLKHPRLIILKSRQHGISTLMLINFFDDALFIPNLNIGLMAQGTDEASKLLERVKIAWDELNPVIKDFLKLDTDKNNTKAFAFNNNSNIFIRVSFRSATLHRLHISELGKIASKYPERITETKKGTLQAIAPGNPVVIESTAEGDNAFKEMWFQARDLKQYSLMDFKPIFLSWTLDRDCISSADEYISPKHAEYFEKLALEHNIKLTQEQKNFWIQKYRELGDDIYSEYPTTDEEAFTVSKDGTYWARLYRQHVIKKDREIDGLFDPNLGVQVSYDLGIDDIMVMCFFQHYKNEYRIIDEYYAEGESLEHYVKTMYEMYENITNIILPHDVKVRELSSGRSRLDLIRGLGVKNITVLPKSNLADGIEAVRAILPKLWIDKKCEYLRACFLNYSKAWDERLGTWKQKPLHNYYSHGADAIRYMVSGINKSQEKAEDKLRYKQVFDGLAL